MTLQMTSGNDNWFTNEMFLQCAKYSEEIAFRHGMQGLTTTKAGTVSDAVYIYGWSMLLVILGGSLIFHFIETIFHLQSDDT